MKIKIKNREIGDGQPPYIIAEVGSNWRNLEDCMNSITQAKLAGADAVKFQMFKRSELFGPNWSDGTAWELPHEWLPKLKEKADAVGIDFMCTAFSPEGYELVDKYVDVHKVASSECCHLRILQKLKELGKPVILSTGAKHHDDIAKSIEVLGPVPMVLLYCPVSYPSNETDLRKMKVLKQLFGRNVGLSDHSTDVYEIPSSACRNYGAAVIEKHFTIIPEVNTPDQPHSLSTDQFFKMVRRIKDDLEGWTLDLKLFPTSEEKMAVLRYNRRLIATKDIHPGDTLAEGTNFGIYRSMKDDTRAAHPMMIDQFVGKRAKVEIKSGDGIWIEDVE